MNQVWRDTLNARCGICSGYEREQHYVGRNKLTMDHIIPLSKGGGHSYKNIQLAHFGCNSRKHNKII